MVILGMRNAENIFCNLQTISIGDKFYFSYLLNFIDRISIKKPYPPLEIRSFIFLKIPGKKRLSRNRESRFIKPYIKLQLSFNYASIEETTPEPTVHPKVYSELIKNAQNRYILPASSIQKKAEISRATVVFLVVVNQKW